MAIHSFKGGTGKSTITANLAVALALQNKRVAVMDMDLQGPGLHVIFGLDPNQSRFTLNDVLTDAAQPEQAVVSMNERLGLNRGAVYFAPASVNVSEMLKTLRTGFEIESFSRVLERVAEKFDLDYLLVDTHPGIENDTLLTMGVCENLVVVSRMDQQDMFGTGVMTAVARSLEKPVHLVLNMVPRIIRATEASRLVQKIGTNFKAKILGWLPFSEDVIDSLSKSVFILSFPAHPLATRFKELAARLEDFNGRDHSK